MTKAPPGVHPKWISHFCPDGSYVKDVLGYPDEEDIDGEVRTFSYRNGEVVEEGTYMQQDFRDVLKDLGF